nr:uncharacterized protein LOC117840346 [Setaria viridis]
MTSRFASLSSSRSSSSARLIQTDKVVSEICGCGNPAKCIQSNAAHPLPLPAASRSPVNATATASPVKLLGSNATVGDERERTEVEARLLPEWALREKAQRTREALAAGISTRLPDGCRRLRLWLDASLGEISNRRRDAHAAPRPHGGNGEAPMPDIVVCEICGSDSIPHLIAKCVRCNAYEHRYCLRVVAYSVHGVFEYLKLSIVSSTTPGSRIGAARKVRGS